MEGELSGTRSDRWVEEPPGQQLVSDRAGEGRGTYNVKVLDRQLDELLQQAWLSQEDKKYLEFDRKKRKFYKRKKWKEVGKKRT